MKVNGFKVEMKVYQHTHPRDDQVAQYEIIQKSKKAIDALIHASKLTGISIQSTKNILISRIQNARKYLRSISDAQLQVSLKTFGFEDNVRYDFRHNRREAALNAKAWITKRVKAYRSKLKTIEPRQKYTKSGASYSTTGGVFISSNSIREMLKRIKSAKVTSFKAPKTKENHIGIEIECLLSDRESLSEFHSALVDSGLERQACAKFDGSIHVEDGTQAVELTLCDTETEIFSTIVKANKVLRAFDASVNSSCGLHVHLDMRNRDASLSARRLILSQPLLFAMVPSSRRKNNFCEPTHFYQDLSCPGERYKAVNLASMDKHSTLEIRLHTGSIDPRKINNWICILLSILKADITSETPTTIEEWVSLLNLPEILKDYIFERVKLFNNGITTIQSHAEFFKDVHYDDHHEDDDCCSDCGAHQDDCDCFTCERCDSRFLSDDSNYDDENQETYCPDCYTEVIDARAIATNGRSRRR